MNPVLFFAIAILLTLAYAYWNGANDRANSLATVVKTRALSYKKAVILGSLLNGAGMLFPLAVGGALVAKTIGKGIVLPEHISQTIVLGGLIGTIAWAWFATRRGIPVSITHSVIGGLMGAGLAAGGFSILNWDILFSKVFIGIVSAPILGVIGGAIIIAIIKFTVAKFFPKLSLWKANKYWRWGQVVSSSFLSFTHGLNDGQNAVGVMALAFFAAGFSGSIEILWWMLVLAGVAIGIGTYVSGFRVMKTVGWKLTKLEPADGFAAEMASSLILFFKSQIGMPVSTTHVAVGGILGVGGMKKLSSINWKLTRGIFIAWILTIPAAASIGYGAHWLLSFVM